MSWGVLGCLGVSWGNKTDRFGALLRGRRVRSNKEVTFPKHRKDNLVINIKTRDVEIVILKFLRVSL